MLSLFIIVNNACAVPFPRAPGQARERLRWRLALVPLVGDFANDPEISGALNMDS